MFSPTTSTLIFGARDAVLVDALMIMEDVDALGDMIASTGKTLTTIFITHGHGGHVFGSDRLIARFPGARAETPSPLFLAGRHRGPLSGAEKNNNQSMTQGMHYLLRPICRR
jgi:glyoxylase-like metal-dependent hydrolase (beta-lactamase superfamily II)